jgi:RNA polymerase sigma factor (sigma-70 family)
MEGDPRGVPSPSPEDCEGAPALAPAEIESFESFWRQEIYDLHRFCLRRMGGNAAEADEAISRVAMRLLHHWRAEVENRRAWLRTVARNTCIDLLRERQKHHWMSIDSLAAHEKIAVEAGASRRVPTPEGTYLEHERQRNLWMAVDGLPPALGRLVRLHFSEEMLLVDLARLTGMSESNVRRRIAQACHHLRAALILRHCPESGPCASRDQETFGVSIPHTVVAVRFIQVVTDDGGERDLYLWLTEAPRRFSIRTIGKLEQYIDRHPAGWRKRLQLARVLRDRGDLRASIEHYTAVLDRRSAHVVAWIELADVVGGVHGADAAASQLDRGARSVRRDVAPLLDALALGWRRRGREGADRLLAMPANAYVYAMAARMYAEAGAVECSAAAFERALELDPQNAVLLAASHDALMLIGRESDAEARLGAALAIDPFNVLALQREIRRRAARGARTDDVRVLVRRLVAVAGNAIETVHVLAELALSRGDLRRAASLIQSLVRDHPANAEAWLRYAALDADANSPRLRPGHSASSQRIHGLVVSQSEQNERED